MPKYIFICGGVISGVGKGIATASIARILEWYGYKTTCLKIDPYVNVDAGTMNPVEHGEVFVLKDGTECDQDMGHYERFLNKELTKENYMTTGSVYLSLIHKERSLYFNGKCVEVVPHVPLEVIEKINKAQKLTKADIVITEIGGTVGEYQNLLFLETARILKLKRPKDVILILVSYLPYQGEGMELKTKPTQYAIRSLNTAGLQPDFVLARASFPLDEKRKEKISFNCGILQENIISAPDERIVYKIPLNFENEKLGEKILKTLGLKIKRKNKAIFGKWKKEIDKIENLTKEVKIGIVGKYFKTGDFVLADTYISVIEAIKHASWFLGYKPKIDWLNSEEYEKNSKTLKELKNYDGIIIPGGFGSRGVEGKILAIKYCRENKIPIFGLCYGLQLMVVEFIRNVCGLEYAHTTEVNPKTKYPVIDILEEQKKFLKEKLYGGTMRLGDWECQIKKGTIAWQAYCKFVRILKWINTDRNTVRTSLRFSHKPEQSSVHGPEPYMVQDSHQSALIFVLERHRHRYEVNPKYHKILQKNGFVFSGITRTNSNDFLVEIGELPQNIHPFFLGTQFHPEFKSRFLNPHPLFVEFIKKASFRF
ncbi:MAG: CTP synthetase [Candidatus Parcubacteria bacterium]|nr:MAG: CTP synthetase [Candidatus Parcubacteria bacterium]